MKIRISGNTLRLRLSQSEVNEVGTEGRVSDSIDFGPRKLIYMLQVVDQAEITASYEGDFVSVNVPPAIANPWVSTDQVGFEADLALQGGKELYVLVEKDFKCLKPREREDESDLFENPQGC
ncbi:hypothetical protein C900_05623 [Fulvivirga imtechensis AK7]|uniref:Uncharacterized protein n=1 Tax=Fulvivirga imtechensis AK7 TaxID=1237149 RepID=L8JJF2_9BACT|nr:hypothetical protein [Fulvivirga imtechensis]ELR68930.1 hypothetical protein C900_05623 [Fulvivirga imtechensis AK7]